MPPVFRRFMERSGVPYTYCTYLAFACAILLPAAYPWLGRRGFRRTGGVQRLCRRQPRARRTALPVARHVPEQQRHTPAAPAAEAHGRGLRQYGRAACQRTQRASISPGSKREAAGRRAAGRERAGAEMVLRGRRQRRRGGDRSVAPCEQHGQGFLVGPGAICADRSHRGRQGMAAGGLHIGRPISPSKSYPMRQCRNEFIGQHRGLGEASTASTASISILRKWTRRTRPLYEFHRRMQESVARRRHSLRGRHGAAGQPQPYELVAVL